MALSLVTAGQYYVRKNGKMRPADALYDFGGWDPTTIPDFLRILDSYVKGLNEQDGFVVLNAHVAHRSTSNPDDWWAETVQDRNQQKGQHPGTFQPGGPTPKGKPGVRICTNITLGGFGASTRAITPEVLSGWGEITSIPELYSFLTAVLNDADVQNELKAGKTMDILIWSAGGKSWSPRKGCGDLDFSDLPSMA